jgi:hypothetical protein
VAVCRRRCGRFVHRPRSAFFSAALQGDNDGQGVAEDTPDRRLGNEAGEAVDVQESLAFWHTRIVTGFPKGRKANFARKTRSLLALAIESYPHDSTKNLELIIVESSCVSFSFPHGMVQSSKRRAATRLNSAVL